MPPAAYSLCSGTPGCSSMIPLGSASTIPCVSTSGILSPPIITPAGPIPSIPTIPSIPAGAPLLATSILL